MNRRQFMQTTAGAAALLATRRLAYPYGQSPLGITKFAVTLPALGQGGANNFGNYITVLSPNTTKFPGTDYYEIVAKQFQQQVHPALPPTTFWGYADATTLDSRYLGGVIVAKRGTPVKLKVTNLLPRKSILPIDPTVVDPTMYAEVGGRTDRIAVHLHGGLVQWTSDGGPFAWYSNAANGGFVHGSSFLNGAGPGAALYDYPNDQSARLLWYHDHAYGITRTNAYAGIASAYLITDDAEAQLVSSGILPDLGGAFPLGIPLVIQDKTFWDPATDPSYDRVVAANVSRGDLWYPHTYEPERWELAPGGSPPDPSVVAEFFSDIMLVNGAPYPTLQVDRRRYRFRLLNGSQARFYNLQMYIADSSVDGITLTASSDIDPNGNPVKVPTNAPGPRMIQIGTEGGFLPGPVVLNNPPRPIGYLLAPGNPRDGNANRYNLLLAPAERADIIVDFRDVPPGSKVILYNDAPAPFPGGDDSDDYYVGGPSPSTTIQGQGPDTRIIMRFEVSSTTVSSDMSFNATLAALRAALPITFRSTQPSTNLRPDDEPKTKTLNEDFDDRGRLIQKLGSPEVSDYLDVPMDVAHRGEVQMWKIYNLTGDTHPMHFHLVDVTIVKREAWKFDSSGGPVLPLQPIPGTGRGPDPNEEGWKETVRMNPGEVVTVLMRFDMPTGAPPSPRLKSSYNVVGAEYVWHCHILEHEEHDMMHALVVI